MNHKPSYVFLAAAVVAALLSGRSALAAQKTVSLGDVVSKSFTIEAIDHTTRIVGLKDKDGLITEVLCGPDVTRFDALKVGDKVTFRYHQSLVTSIRRPGAAPKAAEANAVVRTPGTKPGGTVSQQLTAVVTLNAIDATVPSVTITTENGRRMSITVLDAKNLEGYKAGDKVELTYTEALAVNVESPK